MINSAVSSLVNYALEKGLIGQTDAIFASNLIIDAIGADACTLTEEKCECLDDTLNELVTFAAEKGKLNGDSPTERDLFDTKLMGLLTDRPSAVQAKFASLYAQSAQTATDWYYSFSRNTNYIRVNRVARDIRWKTETKYGLLDITVNLSKPEKDPEAIAKARLLASTGYPLCQLCPENEGYAGRLDHPARQNHRVIPLTICGEPWALQYSPYVYYNEHCIVFNRSHVPMKIDRSAFEKLFDFITHFPHYFIGSNADLPIVGGSILTHEHFQGGHYEFAMQKAHISTALNFKGYESVTAGIVDWPMSVLRLRCSSSATLVDLADKILTAWRGWTDADNGVFAYTDGEPHNTVTPIARRRGEDYELDLVLRCNVKSEEHPDGVFHPHKPLHHIKKENIGLIEVMGLAVLPPRLKDDLERLHTLLVAGKDISEDASLSSHAQWVKEFLPKYEKITDENAMPILEREVGLVFEEVLEDAGVYKRTEKGLQGFLRFAEAIGAELKA